MKFEGRFLSEIEKINGSLNKKGGVKKADKVQRRIGRLMEKYPSMNVYYQIEVIQQQGMATQVTARQKETYGDWMKILAFTLSVPTLNPKTKKYFGPYTTRFERLKARSVA